MRDIVVLERGLTLRVCDVGEASGPCCLGNTVRVEPQAAMVAESPPAIVHLDSERDAAPGEDDARRSRRHRRIWIGAIAVVALLVVLRNLIDLSGSPPGMYVDESSIAYNAWTIAHFGVDEHGIHLSLIHI